MAKLVVHGAMLKCSEGSGSSTLSVLPAAGTGSDEKPAATILDSKPLVNIAPFGMCKSLANPLVASATAAAMGMLTLQPWVGDVTIYVGATGAPPSFVAFFAGSSCHVARGRSSASASSLVAGFFRCTEPSTAAT
jgi:hypothetical protein